MLTKYQLIRRFVSVASKPSTFVDTKTAGDELDVSASRILQYIKDKRLPAEMHGGVYMILRRDLNKVRVRKPGRPKNKGQAHAKNRDSSAASSN
jgi:hypothetical protein